MVIKSFISFVGKRQLAADRRDKFRVSNLSGGSDNLVTARSRLLIDMRSDEKTAETLVRPEKLQAEAGHRL